jgi:putative transposase
LDRIVIEGRNLEEMMAERGVQVDHTNIYRWVQKFAPQLEAELRRSGNQRPVSMSWRMDETYIKVNGQWKYLYRAVDKAGQGRPSTSC